MNSDEATEYYKLEPGSKGCSQYMSTHSIAISLKRIADKMESLDGYLDMLWHEHLAGRL